MSDDGEMLTVAQVAAQWQVSVATVRRYIHSGRLKAVRLPGGAYRIKPADAAAALTKPD